MSGKVYLVGAGPGDPGLLTLRAKELMETADVIVYDRLADERILSYANPQAKLIYVGKAADNHTMPQTEISRLLVELGKNGQKVVRLKGGDPFVFGRGGEEALLLQEAALPFEIVPGISSAIAVPAYAGIPVTHRGLAASFAVITGHEDPNKTESSLHWEKLAQGTDTLIFLMGAANLAKICDKLTAAGRRADTPAALIRWGTRSEQEVLVTDLANAPQAKMKPPLIFLVGETVKLREKLQWFDNIEQRPLWGQRVLVTRARAQASQLSGKLTGLGASVIEAPTIRIAPPSDDYQALDGAIANIGVYNWLIFTSANGVEHFFARLTEANLDSRALHGVKIAAIGSATAKKLKNYGLRADVVPTAYVAEELAKVMLPLVSSGDNILLARAEEAREILPEILKNTGAKVSVAAAYKTVAATENLDAIAKALETPSIDWITFTSSSTVKYLVQKISIAQISRAKIACIGPITAAECQRHGLTPTIVADNYTIDGLVAALVNFVTKN